MAIAFLYSQWVARRLTADGTIDLDAAYDGGAAISVSTSSQEGNTEGSADSGGGTNGEPRAGGQSTSVATVQASTLTALKGHERPAVGKLLFVLMLPLC